jgi:hypothetical protein
MKIFGTESDARDYLKKRVPPLDMVKKVDLELLEKKLFEIPKEELQEGHYEFKGENGLEISYDLFDASRYMFDVCYYEIFKKYFDHEEENYGVKGEIRPVFEIKNFKIKSENFLDTNENHKKGLYGTVFWLPNLKNVNPKLSYNFSYVNRAEIYLVDEAGFLSTPDDLLSFFHEVGHIESRTLNQLGDQKNIKTTISASGIKTEPLKIRAYELQAERDANAWMLNRAKNLFKDLKIPDGLIKDWIHHSQLETYHDLDRWVLEKNKEE